MTNTSDNRKTRDSLVFWLTLIAAAIFLVPIWSVRLLPMGDLGHHVAVAEILRSLHSTPIYEQTFEFTSWYASNSTCYWILAGLFEVFRAETSVRLLISLYILALPIAFFYLLRTLRAPTWPAVASAFFTINHAFTHGYLNFMLAMPLYLTVLAVTVRVFERWSWKLSVACFAMLLLLYWTHLSVFCLALFVIILLAFAVRPLSLLLVLRRLMIPGLGFLVPIFWILSTLLHNVHPGAPESSVASLFEGVYLTPREWLDHLFRDVQHVFSSTAHVDLFFILLGILFVLWILSLVAGERKQTTIVLPLTVFLGTFVGALMFPNHFSFVWDIAPRFVPLMWLSLMTLVTHQLPRRGRLVLFGMVFVLLVFDAQQLTKGFRIFQKDVEPIEHMASLVRKGSKIYRGLYVRNDQSIMFNGGAYWHVDKYLMAWKGTLNEDILPSHPTCIIQFKRGKRLPPLNRIEFYRDRNLMAYDYVIAFSPPPPIVMAAKRQHTVDLILDEGKWKLFRVVKRFGSRR